jgi:hypothetical protein
MKIVEVAEKQIGYTEVPPDSNKTKYGKWFGLDGVPWCGIFVSWCYSIAGFPLGNIGFTKGFAGCQTAVAFFTKRKRIVTLPKEGDIVFFDWNLDGRYDHTGIFVRRIDKNFFETIEGNTSLTNQSNGGQVMRRKRMFGKGVVFVHPKCLDEAKHNLTANVLRLKNPPIN